MKKNLILLVLCLGLVGCGPVYQTRTEYIPPSTPEGKLALNDCLHHQQDCKTDCDSIQVQCEQNEAIVSIASTVADAITKKDTDAKKNHRHAQKCTKRVNTCKNSCHQTYNACYQNVGGTINTYRICVYNCDKLPNQAVRVDV